MNEETLLQATVARWEFFLLISALLTIATALAAVFAYGAFVWRKKHRKTQLTGDCGELHRTECNASRFERFSRVASLTAVVLSLVALVATGGYISKKHQLSDLQNHSRSKLAHAAFDAVQEAKQAVKDLEEAKGRLTSTETEVGKTEVDQTKADTRLADEIRLQGLKDEHAPRVLTKSQKDMLFALLKPEGPQELFLFRAPDQESGDFAAAIQSVLTKAKWTVVPYPANVATPVTFPDYSLEVLIPDNNKPVSRGAFKLHEILTKIGLQNVPVTTSVIPEGKFALYVGPKPTFVSIE
jgi:hypothetical protein